jgi:hypothetical protein
MINLSDLCCERVRACARVRVGVCVCTRTRTYVRAGVRVGLCVYVWSVCDEQELKHWLNAKKN